MGQFFHAPQIPFRKGESGIDPDIGDVAQFLKRHRIDPLPDFEDRPVGGVLARDRSNIIPDGLFALAVLRQHVDDPECVQFLCRIDASAQDHALRHRRSDPPHQETVGAHARKQVEHHLRQPETRPSFSDQHVEREGALEAPT
jgi:hypothetical protein